MPSLAGHDRVSSYQETQFAPGLALIPFPFKIRNVSSQLLPLALKIGDMYSQLTQLPLEVLSVPLPSFPVAFNVSKLPFERRLGRRKLLFKLRQAAPHPLKESLHRLSTKMGVLLE